MIKRIFLLGIVAVVGTVCECTLSPVSGGGGTETGNPELAYCSRAAFHLCVLDSSWQVEAYVPGSSARLTPTTITGQPFKNNPAKRSARQSATIDTIIRVDTLYHHDTMVVHNTIIYPRTAIISDTIATKPAMRSDTVDTIIGTDTFSMVTTYRVVDTIIIHDTLTFYDTLMYWDTVFRFDTIITGDTLVFLDDTPQYVPTRTDWSTSDSGTNQTIVSPDKRSADYHYQTPPGGNAVIVSPQETVWDAETYPFPYSSTRTTMSALSSISRLMSTGLHQIRFEEYTDRDGDSLLLSAHAPLQPQARYRYDFRTPETRTSVFVDFDAGMTGDLDAVSDNRIFFLQRFDTTSGESRHVLFRMDTTATATDSMAMTIDETISSGEVATQATRYLLHRGSDRLLYTDDQLRGVRQTIDYREGPIASLDISVVFTPSLSRNSESSHGSVYCRISLPDGTVGHVLDATINLETGQLKGVYVKKGISEHVRLDSEGNEIH